MDEPCVGKSLIYRMRRERLPAVANFCGECGAAAGSRFCVECGAPVVADTRPASAPPPGGSFMAADPQLPAPDATEGSEGGFNTSAGQHSDLEQEQGSIAPSMGGRAPGETALGWGCFLVVLIAMGLLLASCLGGGDDGGGGESAKPEAAPAPTVAAATTVEDWFKANAEQWGSFSAAVVQVNDQVESSGASSLGYYCQHLREAVTQLAAVGSIGNASADAAFRTVLESAARVHGDCSTAATVPFGGPPDTSTLRASLLKTKDALTDLQSALPLIAEPSAAGRPMAVSFEEAETTDTICADLKLVAMSFGRVTKKDPTGFRQSYFTVRVDNKSPRRVAVRASASMRFSSDPDDPAYTVYTLPDAAELVLEAGQGRKFVDDNVDGGASGDEVNAGKDLPWAGGFASVSDGRAVLEYDDLPLSDESECRKFSENDASFFSFAARP